MPYILNHLSFANAPSFYQLYLPIQKAMIAMPPLEARGHSPLKMTFEDQLKALIFFRFLRKMILHVTSSPLKRG